MFFILILQLKKTRLVVSLLSMQNSYYTCFFFSFSASSGVLAFLNELIFR